MSMTELRPGAAGRLPTAVSAATLLDRPGLSRLGVERTFATGFDPLDTALGGGIRPREFVVVGGRPGAGKTIATLQWARWMAMGGTAVVYACYEHDERSLLGRLLAMELRALADEEGAWDVAENRQILERVSRGGAGVLDATPADPLLARTTARLRSYGDRLFLLRASGVDTGVAELRSLVDQQTDDDVVLFVDYLQKVPGPGEDDVRRAAHTGCALKEMAMSLDVAVVAVSATSDPGLNTRRARIQHLRGSEGIAYEADIVLMLNEMSAAVSKVHRDYDPVRSRTFASRVVFSLEKNRRGQGALDLDFRKDFANSRFDPEGSFTAERLVDEIAGEG